MKKISLKLHRDIITAIVNVCRAYHANTTGDRLFDLFWSETITELLLKFAKLRNRSSAFITVNFKLDELIILRELHELNAQINPAGYETIVLQEYVINPVLRLV